MNKMFRFKSTKTLNNNAGCPNATFDCFFNRFILHILRKKSTNECVTCRARINNFLSFNRWHWHFAQFVSNAIHNWLVCLCYNHKTLSLCIQLVRTCEFSCQFLNTCSLFESHLVKLL